MVEQHLETCQPCRELEELWQDIFGTSEEEPARDPTPDWKEPETTGPMLGEPAGRRPRGRGGAPPPENTCPECGKWKQARYDTCFDCSGMVRCGTCRERYHREEYDECYHCAMG